MKARSLVTCALAAVCSAAWADDPRVETSGTAGWTFSDEVKGQAAVFVPGAGRFDSAGPEDSFAWRAHLGYGLNANVETCGLFDQQATKLGLCDTSSFSVADLAVRNYHGYFAYNFGESVGASVPAGRSRRHAVRLRLEDRQQRATHRREHRASSTWAAGLKVVAGRVFGVRLEGRWTSTYAQFSNQFLLGGGATLRF